MTPRLFVGVHHSPDMLPIILATQAALPGGWVLGPRWPSTHAFVVVEAGGLAWRLDAQPSHALWEPCTLDAWDRPTATWEVLGDPGAGITAARALRQVPYDWDEILRQAGYAAAQLLPWHARWLPRGLATRDVVRRAMICSRLALHVLRPTSLLARGSVDAMRSLLPEACAGAWRVGERDGWLRRQ